MPTVRYTFTGSGTNSSTVQAIMPVVHTELVAAGWTIEWANSSAIGSGTSSDPAWDTTPATNTDNGRVVYRMPSPNPWYVMLVPHYTTVTDRWLMRFQMGLAHDGSGTITSGGAYIQPATTALNVDTSWSLTVSEDFLTLALFLGSGAGWNFIIERPRDQHGAVLAGLTGMWHRSSATTPTYVSHLLPDGSVLHEVTNGNGSFNAIGAVAGTGVVAWSSTRFATGGSKDAAGQIAYPCGPYFPGSGGMWLPRSMLLFAPDDFVNGGTIPVEVDGAVRDYIFPNISATSHDQLGVATYRTAFATE
jgi:hypothetical protein